MSVLTKIYTCTVLPWMIQTSLDCLKSGRELLWGEINDCGNERVCWTSAGDYRNIMLGLSVQIIKETQVIKPVRAKISRAYS